MPMPPIVGPAERRIDGPHHQMWGADANFVITTRTAVGLDRTGGRDRTDLVLVAVGADLHPA